MGKQTEAADAHWLQEQLHKFNPAKHAAPGPAPGNRDRLPKLTLRSVPRYVSAVAAGVADGSIAPKEASALLYAVQVFVGAHKVLGPQGVKKLQAVAAAEGVPPSPPVVTKRKAARTCQQR